MERTKSWVALGVIVAGLWAVIAPSPWNVVALAVLVICAASEIYLTLKVRSARGSETTPG